MVRPVRILKVNTMCSVFNLYHSLGKFNRQQIGNVFLIFPEKVNLHEMLNTVSLENKKKCFKMSSAETFTQSAVLR